jgi:probable H4MPT-linked C1 transfer pathway protein
MPADRAVLGWDVGGAHLKAAWTDGSGAIGGVWQEACPLWQGLDHLHAAIDRILRRAPAAGRHAVTMTGEMTDLFADRGQGVERLVASLSTRLRGEVRYYAGRQGWLDAAAALAQTGQVASANWHASARLLASEVGEAVLVDIGSTTTDLIVIDNHRVASTSSSDADRLAAGELVYTGVVRTPLMALCREAPLAGRWLPLMAEHFATTADVYRLLGWLPEAADQQAAADGAAKTLAASRARLARMLGRDAGDCSEATWLELAAWFADAQLEQIGRGLRLVFSRHLPAAATPLYLAGCGAFVGARLAARLGRPARHFSSLLASQEAGREWLDWCAPAVAVARLLAEDHIRGDWPCA